jgi:hypothetical protein
MEVPSEKHQNTEGNIRSENDGDGSYADCYLSDSAALDPQRDTGGNGEQQQLRVIWFVIGDEHGQGRDGREREPCVSE